MRDPLIALAALSLLGPAGPANAEALADSTLEPVDDARQDNSATKQVDRNTPARPQGAPADAEPLPAYPAPNHTERLFAKKNLQGKTLIEPLPQLFERVEWLTEKPDTAGKVIIIEFWATWCAPCKLVKPKLEALARNESDLVEVILIGGDIGDSAPKIAALVADDPGSPLAHAWDAGNMLAVDIGVQGIPHALVIGTDGVIRWQGYPMDKAFLPAVNDILRADPVTGRKIQQRYTDGPMTAEQRAEIHKTAREYARQMREQAEQRAREENPEPLPPTPNEPDEKPADQPNKGPEGGQGDN